MATDTTRKDLTNLIIAEGDTPSISFQLVDESGVGVPTTSIDSALMTVYEDGNSAIVNSQSGTDVHNLNGGTIDASGNFLYSMVTGDTAIVSTRTREGQTECHIFKFVFVYLTTKQKTIEVAIAIKNLEDTV